MHFGTGIFIIYIRVLRVKYSQAYNKILVRSRHSNKALIKKLITPFKWQIKESFGLLVSLEFLSDCSYFGSVLTELSELLKSLTMRFETWIDSQKDKTFGKWIFMCHPVELVLYCLRHPIINHLSWLPFTSMTLNQKSAWTLNLNNNLSSWLDIYNMLSFISNVRNLALKNT